MQATNKVGFDQTTYETILKHQDEICEQALQKVVGDFRKEHEANKQPDTTPLPNGCSSIYTFTYQGINMPFYIRRENIRNAIDNKDVGKLINYYNTQCQKIFTKTLSLVMTKMTTTPNYLYLADLILGTEGKKSSNDSGIHVKTRRMQLIENPKDQKLLMEFAKDLAGSLILQNATCTAMKHYASPPQDLK